MNQVEEELETTTDEVIEPRLVVKNDDVNTFAHVIEVLMKYCDHTHEQAEQCAWIIHFKGRCVVKNGPEKELIPIKQAICEEGIDAVVE